jgi:phosphoglycerate dehydrogenase-like enzyme
MSGAILVSDFVEARHAAALDAAAPGWPRIILQTGIDADLTAVEVAYFSGDLFPARARELWRPVLRAPRLRWLHTYSAGVDDPVFQRLLAREVRLTSSSGAAAVHIAHTVMLYLLALSRDLRGFLEAQQRHAWEPRPIGDVQGERLGVVGLGPIGLAVAHLGIAFGMRVTALRRTPRGDEPCETWPIGRLHELLALADHVVVALPLTGDTKHIVDADALTRMKPSATFINVGRGELVDEAALSAALADRRIAGAALDVFATEPLPPTSPLWDLPNVIVTPHSAGVNANNNERATAMFVENLRRYVSGQPLHNEVTLPQV